MSFWDTLVKALLGILSAIMGYLWRDARSEIRETQRRIAELATRMDAQDKALAVQRSDADGRQALMLEKIEGVERKIEGMSHVLGTMSETLTQLRLDQARKERIER